MSPLFRAHRDAAGQDLHRLAVEVAARFDDHHPGNPVRIPAVEDADGPVHLSGEELMPLPPPTAAESPGDGRLPFTAALLGVAGAVAVTLALGI